MSYYNAALLLIAGIIFGLVIGYHLAPDTSIWHCAVNHG